jgi:hypothetical protein
MKVSLKRSVDRAMEAYIDWREECVRVAEAYDQWARSNRGGGIPAFSAYTVALDREERAAEVYAARIRRGGRFA